MIRSIGSVRSSLQRLAPLVTRHGRCLSACEQRTGRRLGAQRSRNFHPSVSVVRFPAMFSAAANAVSTVVEDAELTEVFRKDYKPTPYLIECVSLSFDLNEDVTTVHATSRLTLNPVSDDRSGVLFLNGQDDVELVSVKIDGADVAAENQTLTKTSLTLTGVPVGDFTLDVVTKIKPQDNTRLDGLYKSSGNYCTQCEAEGFRGITYYLDRPDVMSKYTVRIEADKEKYPVMLSNGNLEEEGDLDGGRHYRVWVDPFLKPCYLFALVAGDLAHKEDKFTTVNGKDVTLSIYTEKHNIGKVDHAMKCLKEAMLWDEQRFGREYDLNLFNIVVVDDFNMGAMENKSLNIFNSKYVLASKETATDADFSNIQAVIGHEYFHNWTGDRVTCRDWFQLTLKEGLTVWRDQEFSSDLNSRAVERIGNVRVLRAAQFSEDAGPMAHPVRPDSYVKMDNFYTVTVYEKGAEVINLYRTVLGNDGFRKGMDLYFEQYDGKAVTCDDFLDAMSKANNKDLSSLHKWYGQAGTPEVKVTTSYNQEENTYTINVKQHTPPTPGQAEKVPVLIPLKVGLLGPDGKDMPLKLQGSTAAAVGEVVLEFDTAEETYVFVDIPTNPVPSILRSFSAPVKLEIVGQTDEDLVFLFANDSDEFNRWDAGQRLSKKIIKKLYEDASSSRDSPFGSIPQSLVDAFKAVLEDETIDGQFAALALALPTQKELIGEIPEVDPVLLANVFKHVGSQLAIALEDIFLKMLEKNDAPDGQEVDISPEQMAKRAIKNVCLAYLTKTKKPEYLQQCLHRFRTATNMTDSIAAISALADNECDERKAALDEFYAKWKDEYLVVNKWLTIKAMSNIPNKENIAALFGHPAYIRTNPNCNYALFRGFAASPINFHAADGSGYALFIQQLIELDKVNGQVAARCGNALTDWKQFDPLRQELMKKYIQQIVDTPGLSENTKEIMSKSLAA